MKVPDYLQPDLRAFTELSTDRRIAGGPIPFSSIRRWCADEGLRGAEAKRLHMLIRHLDGVQLDHQAKQREAERRRAKVK